VSPTLPWMSLANIPKQSVLAAFIEDLSASITEGTARARATAASATHSEARREDDKDTRGLEESYLAAGQAQRVADLELERAAFRSMPRLVFDDETPLTVGALVLLEDEEAGERVLLITATSGGRKVTVDGRTVSALTPNAPLGLALLGRVVGDEIEIRVKRRRQVFELVDVR
jgi:transcription elongation GreA/GreB family factor